MTFKNFDFATLQRTHLNEYNHEEGNLEEGLIREFPGSVDGRENRTVQKCRNASETHPYPFPEGNNSYGHCREVCLCSRRVLSLNKAIHAKESCEKVTTTSIWSDLCHLEEGAKVIITSLCRLVGPVARSGRVCLWTGSHPMRTKC